MPRGAEQSLLAVDTSVAVAALDSAHSAHAACREVVQSYRPGLAGHAAYETLSVLTRMPGALAIDGPTAVTLIRRVFPSVFELEPDPTGTLLDRFGVVGVTGGAVYDGLVGEAARAHGCRLFTRDLRARRTYDLLGVDYEIIGP